MSSQDSKGYLRGKVGPVVYRSSGGVRIVQSIPREFAQSTATKLNGHEFGLASNLASTLLAKYESRIENVYEGV